MCSRRFMFAAAVLLIGSVLTDSGSGLHADDSTCPDQPGRVNSQAGDVKRDTPKVDLKADEQAVQGVWKVAIFKDGSRTFPAEGIKQLEVKITNKKLTMSTTNWNAVEGDYQLDSGKMPKWIDLTDVVLTSPPPDGQQSTRTIQKGIYEMEGDTLKIVLRQADGGERPKDFTGGPGFAMLVLKRADAAK